MYKLIIWSALCTSADPLCELGDWTEHSVWGARVTCNSKLESHKISGDDHRGACLYIEGLRMKEGLLVPDLKVLRGDI